MNTRSTLNLTEIPLNDLLITSNKRNESEPAENHETRTTFIVSSSLKEETPSAPIPSTLLTTDRSETVACPSSAMTDAELAERFFQKIPVFKPIEDSDVHEFIAKAEAVFIRLQYTDEIRLLKIRDKLNESLHPIVDRCQKKNK